MKLKGLVFYSIVILIIFLILLSPNNLTRSEELKEVDGFKIIYLEGEPYQIGLQQGRALKPFIKIAIDKYLHQKVIGEWVKLYANLKKESLQNKSPYQYLLEKCKIMEKYIPEEYIQEMKGLAEGAGIPYEDILILNTHADFFAMLCSGFAAFGSKTENGKLITGRNLDWGHGFGKELDEFTTIMVYRPKAGFPFVSFGYPGLVGVLTGMNNQTLTVELNYSMAKDNSLQGMPVMFLLRSILQYQSDIEKATSEIINAKRCAGFNILLTEGKNRKAKVVEITAKNFGIIEPQDESIVTTNHFTSSELAGQNNPFAFSSLTSIDTRIRYERLQELILEYQGKINSQIACEFMQDFLVKQKSTLQSIVFIPEDLEFYILRRSLEDKDYTHFNLKELLK